MKYFKPAAYTLLTILIIWLFYVSFQTQKDIDQSIQLDKANTGAIVAIPVQENNLNYSGTIRENDEAVYKYSLEKNGKVLLYLKSDNQDLFFLSGLEVEAVGDIMGKFEGVAIMNVKSIKLK